MNLRKLPLPILCVVLAGCPGDETATGDTEGSSSSSESGGPSTTIDPTMTASSADTSSGTMSTTTDATESSGDTSTTDPTDTGSTGVDESSTTDDPTATDTGSSSGGVMDCGNGVIDDGEACDGDALGDQTCASLGQGGGVLACAADCSDFDLAGCVLAPDCIETDLGSATGLAVAGGNTTNDDEDFAISCAGVMNTAPDHVLFWVAPADGTYVMHTEGSDYDTALALYADCDAVASVACDDDGGDLPPTSSRLARAFSAGDSVIVVVSGYAAATGNWTLAIEPLVLEGPCCAAHPEPGCDIEECTAAVCDQDPACCEVGWDDACAALATGGACAICDTPDVCGNGTLDGMGEACDGFDFGGESCQSLGYDAGALDCLADCSALDESGCFDYGGDCCAPHAGLGCDDDACTDTVCALDSSCCEFAWGDFCSQLADDNCGPVCNAPGICNNGIVDAPQEECDEADLAGQSCQSLGFDGGNLLCAVDCTLDAADCDDFAGDCCAAHAPGIGCDDAVCTAVVCEADPFCCVGAWDDACANRADTECTACGAPAGICGNGIIEADELCDGDLVGAESCAGNGFFGGAVTCGGDCLSYDYGGCYDLGDESCCDPHVAPSCDNAPCVSQVCAADPSCCVDEWTDQCAASAAEACVVCGGDPGVPACVEENLDSDVGNPVTSGNLAGEDEELVMPCGGGGGVDHTMYWVAPADGTYTFSTVGSSFDTVLGVFSTCDAASALGCNDDSVMLQSVVTIDLAAGQPVVIAVSGFNGAVGDWQLSIQ